MEARLFDINEVELGKLRKGPPKGDCDLLELLWVFQPKKGEDFLEALFVRVGEPSS